MYIAIVANGHLDEQLLPVIKQADYIIGVDRAAYWLIRHGVTPHIAVGDFDSTIAREFSAIQDKAKTIKELPHPKDQTDLELAIKHTLGLKPAEVTIYGATGSRLDHTLTAVNLLEQFFETKMSVRLRDLHNEIFLVRSACTIQKSSTYRYLSVLAHTQEIVVTIKGALYPLTKQTIQRQTSLGISNEITDQQAKITIHSGIALIIQSRD